MSDRCVSDGTAAGRHELRSGQLVQRCSLIASGRALLNTLNASSFRNQLASVGFSRLHFSCEDVWSRSAKQLDTFRTLGDSAGAGGSMVSSPGFLRSFVLHFPDLYVWYLASVNLSLRVKTH